MTMTASTSQKAGAALVLALLGGAAGYGFGRLVKKTGSEFQGWSDPLALVLAVALFAIGALVLILTFNRASAAKMVGGDAAYPATPAQLSFYRQQAFVLVCAGIMLALPVLTLTLLPNVDWAWRTVIMAVIVGCFAVQTTVNLIIWHRADEFVRRLITQTAALCFWILQAALFLWACAERLGLLASISSWDSIAVLMTVYLIVSAVVSIRLGVR